VTDALGRGACPPERDAGRRDGGRGSVLQVSVSRGGVPKLAIPAAELSAAGVVGDSWRYPFHGGRRRAVLLVTLEGIEELVAQGFPLFPGALGENITTRDLDRRALRLGQRLRVGDAAIVLTEIRTPCATIGRYGNGIQAAVYDAQVQAGDHRSPRWGLSGFYASVVQPGAVRAGDAVTVEAS
jgi:MOSC domain-containing protein YiiM